MSETLITNYTQLIEQNKTVPLYQVARDIRMNWKKVNYAAVPYLDAMSSLTDITDNYIHDSGKSIVLYFLSNAGAFRGEYAKSIKAYLKHIAK